MKPRSKSPFNIFTVFALLLSLLGSALTVTPVRAASFTVTKTTDTNDGTCDSDCSLREAISAANAAVGADTITVPAGAYTLTIAGTGEDLNATGDLDIAGDLTINGAGASATIIRAGTLGYPDGSANGIDRVFHIPPSTLIVHISGVTIANGKTTSAGGGIYKNAGGTLTVENTIFSGNSASDTYGGGAIYNGSGTLNVIKSSFASNFGTYGGALSNYFTLSVTNSAFTGNVTSTGGGAIDSFGAPATAIVRNSTFSGNTAPANAGGGIYNENSATLLIWNTILANNTGGDCYKESGTVSGSNNLIEIDGAGGNACGTTSPINGMDPQLGTLTGSPAYFPIGADSPAFNAGNDAICAAAPVSATSQNGASRPQGAHCDIGSFEYIPDPQTSPSFTVTKTADTNDLCEVSDCSLREAIKAANTAAGADVITLLAGTYTLTIAGAGEDANATGDLDITDDVTINGVGITSLIQAGSAGNGIDRVMQIASGKTVTLTYIAIANGKCSGCNGGGIYNDGALTADHLTLSGNSAVVGGGIFTAGALTVTGSTFSSNTSSSYGAGIVSDSGTTVDISNSAFSGNIAGIYGGAIHSSSTPLTVKNSTFSGNSNGILNGGSSTLNLYNTIIANSTGTDCENYGTIGTEKNNLLENAGSACGFTNGMNGDIIGVDPLLSGLADNGGYTQTFALGATSPAINTGDDTICLNVPVNSFDQRGTLRPQGAHCDIGSFEFTDTVAPNTSILTKPPVRTLNTSAAFTFSGTDNHSLPANLTFECKLDGAAFAPCSSPKSYSGLTAIKHTFRVRAKDEFGNVDLTPASYSWTVQKERAKNGGFNTYTSSPQIPQFWVRSPAFSPITDGKDTAVKKEGIASVKINGAGTTKMLNQTLILSGVTGDKFTFTFWAKGASIPAAGICRAQVLLYDGATLKLTKTVNCSTGTYTPFQKKTLTFNATSNYTKAIIRFTYGKASGTIWFDLVSLIK